MSVVSGTPTYAQAEDVWEYLGVITEAAEERRDIVNRMILMAENRVERMTDTCFAGKPCVSTEMHSFTAWRGGWFFGAGIPIKLKHAPIRRIISLQVFTGREQGGYEEWVGKYNEGRDSGMWWVDYVNGWLYLRTFFLYYGGVEIKVTYEYGYDELPPAVHEYVVAYVAKMLVATDFAREVILQGGGFTNSEAVMKFLDERLKELEQHLSGFKTLSGLTL